MVLVLFYWDQHGIEKILFSCFVRSQSHHGSWSFIRHSGLLYFVMSLLLLCCRIANDLGQSQMFLCLAGDFVLVLQHNSAVLTNLNSITASWARRQIVSPILRKDFSLQRISYYPNSVASYQIILLQLSGDINPNPGPNGIKQHNSTEQQRSTSLLTFYANA